jgi:hypothetical protein
MGNHGVGPWAHAQISTEIFSVLEPPSVAMSSTVEKGMWIWEKFPPGI